MADNKQQQQLKEITEKLEQGVKDLFTSEKYMEYLRVMSQFHNYSFSNTLLIAMQKPEATLVAGYGAWQTKFERNVMKGEKAIKIFAPAPRKVEVERDMLDPDTKRPVIDENGEVKKEKVTVQQPYFKVTSVFDVSQTDGKPLPELDTVHDLTDSVEGYNIFFEALKRTSKVPIDFQPIEGGSHGFYHQVEKRIAIAEGMSQAQNVKTGIHELAHSRLHDIDTADAENGVVVDRRTREVQAESIAYTVCQHYGIDTSDYSFGYIAGWSEGKDMKELRGSMEIIRREADSMIKEIDRHLADIRREREQESELTAEEEKSFIAKYYVVEDLQVRGALQIEKFDDLETALEAYFTLPDDKVRALGIENSKPRTGSLDFIHCHDGKDEIVQDYQRVDGWMNPEIIAVVDRIQTVLEEREAISERDIISSLVSENTEPSQALGGHSPQEIEKMVVETALLNDVVMLDENGKLVDGFSIRDEVLEPIVQYANEVGATIEKQSVAKEEPLKSAIVPLCNLTFVQAKEKGEVDAWKASRKETEACAEQFSAEFGKAYHERRMPEFLAEMADKYGMERCKIVLASTIQLADHDGRYYPSTKADAAKITIPGTDTEDHTKDMRRYYSVSCHPVMVNSAFRELQRMERGQVQEQRKVLSVTEHDMAAPKSSVLSRLQEKQKQVTQNKTSPAKAEDKKRGVEL